MITEENAHEFEYFSTISVSQTANALAGAFLRCSAFSRV